MIARILMTTALGLVLAVGGTGVAVAGNGPSDEGCFDACAQVPEPSSLVLLATGLGALAWTIRRRR